MNNTEIWSITEESWWYKRHKKIQELLEEQVVDAQKKAIAKNMFR